MRPQSLRRPLPDVPLFSDPFLVHSGVEEEGDNPTVRHHSSMPVLAPTERTVKYQTVAESARVLPRVSAPTSGSGSLPKPSPLGGDVLHADVSVPAAVANMMESHMESTALGEIVHQQWVRQKEEVERRDHLLIEALPIEPVVEKAKEPRKPVDPTKKQHFKAVGPYHGTLGLPTEAELDTGPPVTEEGEQLVINKTRDELNAAGPVMVDGKLKVTTSLVVTIFIISCVCVYVKENSLHLD